MGYNFSTKPLGPAEQRDNLDAISTFIDTTFSPPEKALAISLLTRFTNSQALRFNEAITNVPIFGARLRQYLQENIQGKTAGELSALESQLKGPDQALNMEIFGSYKAEFEQRLTRLRQQDQELRERNASHASTNSLAKTLNTRGYWAANEPYHAADINLALEGYLNHKGVVTARNGTDLGLYTENPPEVDLESLKEWVTEALDLTGSEARRLLIPVNNGTQHFVCLDLSKTSAGEVTVTLRDSMDQAKVGAVHKKNNELLVANVKKALLGATKVTDDIIYSGEQGENASCPFYAVREVVNRFSEALPHILILPDNDLSKAAESKDIAEFQLAMSKKVAKKSGLEDSDKLELDELGILHTAKLSEAYKKHKALRILNAQTIVPAPPVLSTTTSPGKDFLTKYKNTVTEVVYQQLIEPIIDETLFKAIKDKLKLTKNRADCSPKDLILAVLRSRDTAVIAPSALLTVETKEEQLCREWLENIVITSKEVTPGIKEKPGIFIVEKDKEEELGIDGWKIFKPVVKTWDVGKVYYDISKAELSLKLNSSSLVQGKDLEQVNAVLNAAGLKLKEQTEAPPDLFFILQREDGKEITELNLIATLELLQVEPLRAVLMNLAAEVDKETERQKLRQSTFTLCEITETVLEKILAYKEKLTLDRSIAGTLFRAALEPHPDLAKMTITNFIKLLDESALSMSLSLAAPPTTTPGLTDSTNPQEDEIRKALLWKPAKPAEKDKVFIKMADGQLKLFEEPSPTPQKWPLRVVESGLGADKRWLDLFGSGSPVPSAENLKEITDLGFKVEWPSSFPAGSSWAATLSVADGSSLSEPANISKLEKLKALDSTFPGLDAVATRALFSLAKVDSVQVVPGGTTPVLKLILNLPVQAQGSIPAEINGETLKKGFRISTEYSREKEGQICLYLQSTNSALIQAKDLLLQLKSSKLHEFFTGLDEAVEKASKALAKPSPKKALKKPGSKGLSVTVSSSGAGAARDRRISSRRNLGPRPATDEWHSIPEEGRDGFILGQGKPIEPAKQALQTLLDSAPTVSTGPATKTVLTPEQQVDLKENEVRLNRYFATEVEAASQAKPFLDGSTFTQCGVIETCLSLGRETRLDFVLPSAVSLTSQSTDPNFNTLLFDFVHRAIQKVVQDLDAVGPGRQPVIKMNNVDSAKVANNAFTARDLAIIQYCHFMGYICKDKAGQTMDKEAILMKATPPMEIAKDGPYALAFKDFIKDKMANNFEAKEEAGASSTAKPFGFRPTS